MSKYTIEDRGTFKVVTSTSGKRFYVYKEKLGFFAKIFIKQDMRCIADSFQIGLLESIIFASNNNALTLRFWITNRKKLAPNLAFFFESEIRFYPTLPKNELQIIKQQLEKNMKEPDYKDSFQDYYYSPINTLGFVDPPQYPSISDDSVRPSSSSDDNSSSSSSFDFGGGDTGGGGAGGDY